MGSAGRRVLLRLRLIREPVGWCPAELPVGRQRCVWCEGVRDVSGPDHPAYSATRLRLRGLSTLPWAARHTVPAFSLHKRLVKLMGPWNHLVTLFPLLRAAPHFTHPLLNPRTAHNLAQVTRPPSPNRQYVHCTCMFCSLILAVQCNVPLSEQ